MSEFSYSFDVEQAVADLSAMAEQWDANAQTLVEKHVNAVGDESSDLAPVLTGELRDSKVVTIGDHEGSVEYTAPYAVWVDRGHHTRSGSFVPPNPFLTAPAFAHEHQFQQEAEGIIE